MTDRASRILFLVELVILALPATIVYAVLTIIFFNAASVLKTASDVGPLSSEGSGGPWTSYMILAAPAVFALGFSAFWVLAIRFLVAGRDSLARASFFPWVTAFLMQGIGFVGAFWSFFGDAAGNAIAGITSVLSLILFLLPPLLHMAVAISRGSQQVTDHTQEPN